MKLLWVALVFFLTNIVTGMNLDLLNSPGSFGSSHSTSRQPSQEDCAEAFTCEGKELGYYPNIHNCSTAFNCQSDGQYIVICPSEQFVVFNPFFECVQDGDGSGCIPCPQETIPSFCLQPFSCEHKSDGCHPDPWACSTYFICKDGQIYAGSDYIPDCPPGTVYDPEQKTCVSLRKSCVPICSNERPQVPSTTQIPDITPATTTAPCPETCTEICGCKPDGVYPSPFDCENYFTCTAGVASSGKCSGGQVFNPATLACEPPEDGGICWNCVPTTESPPTTLPTTPGPITPCPETCTEICGCKPDGVYPSPFDCGKYFTCTAGVTSSGKCSGGQVFNPATLACEPPEDGGICWNCVPTTESPPTTVEPTVSTPSPTATPCPETCMPTCNCKPDGTYPHPGSCQHYYTCTAGVFGIHYCDGWFYNPDTQTCEDPSAGNVACWHCVPTTEPTTQPPVTTPGPTTQPPTTVFE